MAKTGRPPKPTALKALEGNPGKRPLNTTEPQPPKVRHVRVPRGLSADAAKFWRRIMPALADLDLLTIADIPAAIQMAEHYSIAVQAARVLEREGLTVLNSQGRECRHPLLQVLRDASTSFRAYAAEFGLTPGARTRLHTAPPQKEKTLEELLSAAVGNMGPLEESVNASAD